MSDRSAVLPFVGRERDLSELANALGRRERLVTVLGPGGIGKSRLAHELVRRELDGRAPFVALDDARTPSDLCAALARALDLSLEQSGSVGEAFARIASVLVEREERAVVLDGFERIAPFAAEAMGVLCRDARSTTFIVTSRERLRLAGERIMDLAPLGPEAARDLFVAWARVGERGYTPEATEIPTIDEICEALDGMPLAIGLAAARVHVLSPVQIAERLRKKIDVLGPAPRDAPRRHATLRATLEWSYELLTEPERRAWAQCSVFVGGFDADAAEVVIDAGGGSTLDLVQQLRDKSLLHSRPSSHSKRVRFGMYEAARDFAASVLDVSGEREAVENRHTGFFVERGALAADSWERALGDDARAFFTDERDNIAAAHARALVRETPDMIVYAALALQQPLILEGPTQARLDSLDATLAALGDKNVEREPLAGWLLLSRADALERLGRLGEARADAEAAASLARTHGDSRLQGRIGWRCGAIHMASGRLDDAERELDRALSLARATSDELLEGRVLGALGALHVISGDHARAAEELGRARAIQTRIPERSASPAMTLVALGELAHVAGHVEEATMRYEDASRALRLGGARAEPWIALGVASLALDGDPAKCLRLVERALRRPSQAGDRTAEVLLHALHAHTLEELGRRSDARRAIERAEALAERVGAPRLFVVVGALSARLDAADGGDGIDRARAKLARIADAVAAAPALEGLVQATDQHIATASGATSREASASGATSREASAPRSTWERHARRLLARVDRNELGLVVATDGSWFRPPGGATTDLRGRRALRLIVERLATERALGSERALSVDEIFRVGWPTDRAHADAATKRVYVAVSSLRKLGLDGVLERTDDGYRFDPGVPLSRDGSAPATDEAAEAEPKRRPSRR